MKILKLKILKVENIKASRQVVSIGYYLLFCFSDRVLIYGIAKAGVLNRFVDIVVHISLDYYLDCYIYLDLFGLY